MEDNARKYIGITLQVKILGLSLQKALDERLGNFRYYYNYLISVVGYNDKYSKSFDFMLYNYMFQMLILDSVLSYKLVKISNYFKTLVINTVGTVPCVPRRPQNEWTLLNIN